MSRPINRQSEQWPHRVAGVLGDPHEQEDGEHAHERWRWGEEAGHHMEPPRDFDPGFREEEVDDWPDPDHGREDRKASAQRVGEDFTHDPHAKYRNKGLTFPQSADTAADEAGRTHDTHEYIDRKYPDISGANPDYEGEDYGEDFARPHQSQPHTLGPLREPNAWERAHTKGGEPGVGDQMWLPDMPTPDSAARHAPPEPIVRTHSGPVPPGTLRPNWPGPPKAARVGARDYEHRERKFVPDNGARIIRDEESGLGYDIIGVPSPDGRNGWDVVRELHPPSFRNKSD